MMWWMIEAYNMGAAEAETVTISPLPSSDNVPMPECDASMLADQLNLDEDDADYAVELWTAGYQEAYARSLQEQEHGRKKPNP